MEKSSIEICKKCKGQGIIYYDKIQVCENCLGKRCYLCDKDGPYKYFYECPHCWGCGDNILVKKFK